MSSRIAPRTHGSSIVRLAIAAGLTLVAAVGVTACGGGGGGSDDGPPPPTVTGNTFAPTTGPGDVEGYFPASLGNQWFLEYSGAESGAASVSGLLSMSVTGTKPVLGANATILYQEDVTGELGSVENYYGISPGGITYLGNNDATDDLTPRLLPWVQLLFPVNLGTVSTVTGTNLPIGTDNAGNTLTLDVTQRVQNAAFESVNVPAGSFTRALKQVTTIDGTVRNLRLNQSVDISGEEVNWSVPGVGIVKSTSSVSVDVESSSSTAQLRGYVVNGVKRGLGLPFDLIGDLSPVTGDPSPPIGHPAIATDGVRFLVVARRATGVPGSYSAQWVASLVNLDGTVLGTVALDAPRPVHDLMSAEQAAVAFDGTNYLVVMEQDNHFASSGNQMSLVAARVSASGTLVGGTVEVAAPGSNSPALAFDGARYLLAYSRSDYYEGYGRLSAAFISPLTGQATGGAFPIASVDGYQRRPDVAFDGTNYLVVWDQTDFNGQEPGVRAARVTPVGSVLDPGGFAVHKASACCLAYYPTVAFDGNNYLVAWQDYRQRQDNLHTNIYATRVTPGAQLLDGAATMGGFPVTTSVDAGDYVPQLAFFDGNYLVAWVSSPAIGVYGGLRGARVSPAGVVISPGASGMLLTSVGYQFHPALAATPGGAMLTWVYPRAAAGGANAAGGLSIYPFGP